MPKSQTYMTRALQSRDPRFAQILEALGYERPKEPEKAKEPEKDEEEKPKPKRRRRRKKLSISTGDKS